MLAGAIRLLQAMGPVRASNMMGALFRVVGPLLPVTRVADANLHAALPQYDARERTRIIRAMWENLGRTAGEFPHLADLVEDTPSGPGWEMVDGAILVAQAARGGPAVFVSGHIGNWEMLPPAVGRYGIAFSGVYREASNTSVDKLVQDLRRRAMGQAVPMFPKGSKGARAAFVHMKRGGYLGMLTDQKMNDGIEARLFGLPAMTAPAAAVLAVRFGCPIVPGYVRRVGPARLRVVVDAPILPPAPGDEQAAVAMLTQAINDRLEAWITERPEDWLWVHRRFPQGVIEARLAALPPGS